jgi:transposase InsO family protein
VIPRSLVRAVITANHDPIFAAHPGQKRTFDVISLRYWWPGMRRDIDQYVRECDACQRRKQGMEFKAPLGDVTQATYPFEITSMDICGPYPLTPRKNRYLLTFICHLTKYAESIPISDMSAETCARAYATHIIARHGTGSILVTDQGRSFTSVFFQQTCKILGIRKLQTSSYHPSSNGTIERYHRSMNQGLSHYVNASGNNWDILIPFYLMAYRATPHGTTEHSPYFLLHVREMVLPTSQDLRAKMSPELRGTEHECRLNHLKDSLRRAYQAVRKNSRKSHQINKGYYDRKAKLRKFAVGDVVYLYNPALKQGQCQKFKKPWTGPYKVVAKLSDLNYKIVNQQGKESVVHVNRLKVAHSQGNWNPKSGKEKFYRKRKAEPKEEEEEVATPPRGITTESPQDETPNSDAEGSTQEEPTVVDTPTENLQRSLDAPGSERADPSYAPPDTPRSRRELGTTRLQPPITRLRARLQATHEPTIYEEGVSE